MFKREILGQRAQLCSLGINLGKEKEKKKNYDACLKMSKCHRAILFTANRLIPLGK